MEQKQEKRTVIIATSNIGKTKEYKAMLESLGFDAVSMVEKGFKDDIVEDGETFEENARIKARAVFKHFKGKKGISVLADDSGLVVDYLNGEPGVRSARFAPAGERRKTILKLLEDIPYDKRTAKFVCCICYIDELGNENVFTGECFGHIGYENLGENGFGYDPIFMTDEKTSMAMLSDEEKNKLSHRGNALRTLLAALENTENKQRERQ